jgi:aryl-alcohol dehydrogenase-like predicted oxidoreductase
MCNHEDRDTPKTGGRVSLTTAELGTTGMALTRVGFGAWAIGGGGWAAAWGPQDDDESVAAIQHAVASGINWIDTAAVYGLGHSEEVVGRALAAIPADQRPYVFTKCGLVWDDADRTAKPRRVGDPAIVRRDVESSLRRLGVERIDLYQVHWPAEDGTPLEEYWQVMVDLRTEGKVRAIGLSNHDVDQLQVAEKIGHVDSLQPPFSAIKRASARELAWCHENGTGAIVYSPMQSGLLTGAFTAERVAAARRRLAPGWPRVHDQPGPQPRPHRRTRARRPAPRGVTRRRRRGVDARLAGRHGRDRRRPQARADRRLDRGERPRADRRRPRGDRPGHHPDRSGRGSDPPAQLTAPWSLAAVSRAGEQQ